MPRLSLLLALFFSSMALNGQTVIYPVKIDHKWAYINSRGRIVVPPRHEQIAQNDLPWHGRSDLAERSGFRLVELDKKLGLINKNKQEVLSPAYKAIYPLSSAFFAVQTDSLLTVVDKDENILIEKRFEDIRLLGSKTVSEKNFFAVKNGEHWGVYNDGGKEILPIQYDTVQFINAGRGYFKVKKDQRELWGLVDIHDKAIFPYTYLDIAAYHDNFVATYHHTGKWEAWDSLGRQILKAEWTTFTPLNQHLMLMGKGDNQSFLYSFARRDTIPYDRAYKTFERLDDKYILFRKNQLLGILDSAGQEVLEASYLSIRASTDSFYRVRQQLRWGLHEIGNGLVLPCEYMDILPFKGRYAIAYRPEGAGIIDIEMKEIIPALYDSIRREGDIFKGFQGDNVTLIELDEKSTIIRMDDYNNVRTITIGRRNNRTLIEARPIKRRKSSQSESYYIDSYTSPREIEGTSWRWYMDKDTRRWGLKTGDSSTTIPPVFRSVKHVGDGALSLIYTLKDPVSNTFAEWAAAPFDTLCRMSVFSHTAGKFISPNDFLGLRRHDFERGLPYAALIDTSGQFGLVNRQGHQAKDSRGKLLRFSYIGEFVDGIAKVCTGGQLKDMEDPSLLKYTLEEREVFLFAYSLIPSFPAEDRLKAGRILVESLPGETLKWGYIDTLGNYVIKPQYDFALDFTQGQAVAVKNKNWGVINQKNEVIIDFDYGSISDFYGQWRINKRVKGAIFFNRKGWQLANGDYQRRGQFHDGYCKVMQNNRWGFIDETGQETIPCKYKEVHNFSEGLAAVYYDGRWAFVDTIGQMVIDLSGIDIDTLSNFHNGLCWFKQNGKYGYLNSSGSIALEAEYVKAFDFQHGVARVVKNRKTGLIDTNGLVVLEAKQFERIDAFNEWELAVVMETFRSGKRGLINSKGAILTDIKYKVIEPFKEGLAIASTDGKKFTLVNKKGQEIIPQEYEVIGEVSEGVVAVKKLQWEPWHYIDTTGQQAFKGDFEVVSPFRGGFAEVQSKRYDPETRMFIDKTGKPLNISNSKVEFFQDGIAGIYLDYPVKRKLNYCYADAKGKHLFDSYFQAIEPFEGENAMIKLNWRNGFINRRGFMIISPKYVALQKLEAGMIMARPPAFGISSRQGEVLIPAKYDHIELLTGGIYRVEQGEKIGYISDSGNWIWELQN